MCGFLALASKNYKFLKRRGFSRWLKKRGPDKSGSIRKGGYVFVHHLLHLCGERLLQPLVDEDVVCLFNGEIYNYRTFNKDFKSDGECLIYLYRLYGDDFPTKLDGEFAIALFDFRKQIVLLASDAFATKPLFYYFDNAHGFVVSSIRRTITENLYINESEIKKLEANSILKFDFSNNLIKRTPTHIFELYQRKNQFDDYIAALEKAVLKRVSQNINGHGFFINLSSGYDSGTLALILKNLKQPFTSFTIPAKENLTTLKKRLEFDFEFNSNRSIQLSSKDYLANKKNVLQCIDGFNIEYTNWEEDEEGKKIESTEVYNCAEDSATVGLNVIFKKAMDEGLRVHLSGHGADEILSDYGADGTAFSKASQLRGRFPNELETVFPWRNFFGGTNALFISKEEGVGSLYGIENRYPFLDVNVVQEFLYLKPELKNQKYKGPLHALMERFSYPFDENVKIGFKPKKNLVL